MLRYQSPYGNFIDPDHFHSNPGMNFHFDPDMTFQFDCDPDPYCFKYNISRSTGGQPAVIYLTIILLFYSSFYFAFYYMVSIFFFIYQT